MHIPISIILVLLVAGAVFASTFPWDPNRAVSIFLLAFSLGYTAIYFVLHHARLTAINAKREEEGEPPFKKEEPIRHFLRAITNMFGGAILGSSVLAISAEFFGSTFARTLLESASARTSVAILSLLLFLITFAGLIFGYRKVFNNGLLDGPEELEEPENSPAEEDQSEPSIELWIRRNRPAGPIPLKWIAFLVVWLVLLVMILLAHKIWNVSGSKIESYFFSKSTLELVLVYCGIAGGLAATWLISKGLWKYVFRPLCNIISSWFKNDTADE